MSPVVFQSSKTIRDAQTCLNLPSTVGLRRVSCFEPDRQKYDCSHSAQRCVSTEGREEDARPPLPAVFWCWDRRLFCIDRPAAHRRRCLDRAQARGRYSASTAGIASLRRCRGRGVSFGSYRSWWRHVSDAAAYRARLDLATPPSSRRPSSFAIPWLGWPAFPLRARRWRPARWFFRAQLFSAQSSAPPSVCDGSPIRRPSPSPGIGKAPTAPECRKARN